MAPPPSALVAAIHQSIRQGGAPSTSPSVQPKERVPAMKIKTLETFLANAGLRNYLFVRLTTDTGLTGIGEASLEWQERAVEVLLNEWVASRIIGRDPFDIEVDRRRHDPRPVPGRLDGDDRDQRRRDRDVGPRSARPADSRSTA